MNLTGGARMDGTGWDGSMPGMRVLYLVAQVCRLSVLICINISCVES